MVHMMSYLRTMTYGSCGSCENIVILIITVILAVKQ